MASPDDPALSQVTCRLNQLDLDVQNLETHESTSDDELIDIGQDSHVKTNLAASANNNNASIHTDPENRVNTTFRQLSEESQAQGHVAPEVGVDTTVTFYQLRDEGPTEAAVGTGRDVAAPVHLDPESGLDRAFRDLSAERDAVEPDAGDEVGGGSVVQDESTRTSEGENFINETLEQYCTQDGAGDETNATPSPVSDGTDMARDSVGFEGGEVSAWETSSHHHTETGPVLVRPPPSPEGAVGAGLQTSGVQQRLVVNMSKEQQKKEEASTFTVPQGDDLPPSYEEAMGLLANQGAAFSGATQPSNQRRAPAASSQKEETASATEGGVSTAPPDSGNLYYMDFIPSLDFRRKPEVFTDLVKRANVWLEQNATYSVISVETVVQYWARSHGYNPYRAIATRTKLPGDDTICIHVLRVWFRLDDSQTEAQFLYYQDFWTPYERATSDLVDMINSPTYSLPGVIIRVETVVHKKGALHNYYDAERMRITQWTESASEDKLFTYFLRVFTLKSAANQRRGRIGFMDFVPERTNLVANRSSKILFYPHEFYEPFPKLVRNFRWWLRNRLPASARLVTVQSVPVKVKTGNACFWQRLNFTEKSGLLSESQYLVVLRAFYEDHGGRRAGPALSPGRNVTCRSFAPLQLTNGPVMQFENFVKMAERVANWVKLTGAKVWGVETVKIPMYPAAKKDRFSDAEPVTYTSWDIAARHYADHAHWLYVIRLYVEEEVEEPPPSCLPSSPPHVIPHHLQPPPPSIAIQPGTALQ